MLLICLSRTCHRILFAPAVQPRAAPCFRGWVDLARITNGADSGMTEAHRLGFLWLPLLRCSSGLRLLCLMPAQVIHRCSLLLAQLHMRGMSDVFRVEHVPPYSLFGVLPMIVLLGSMRKRVGVSTGFKLGQAERAGSEHLASDLNQTTRCNNFKTYALNMQNNA